MPTLHTYVMTTDDGFAPNPFHGVLTLATCMVKIRRAAKKNDYIIGLSGAEYRREFGDAETFRVIYAAKVTEAPLPFDDYWNDPRFAMKRPDRKAGDVRIKGDNAYHKLRDGEETAGLHVFKYGSENWVQERCRHPAEAAVGDLSGQNVLISRDFIYWGCKAPVLPSCLKETIRVGVRYRSRANDPCVRAFEEWFSEQKKNGRGRLGCPLTWGAGPGCQSPCC